MLVTGINMSEILQAEVQNAWRSFDGLSPSFSSEIEHEMKWDSFVNGSNSETLLGYWSIR